MRYKNVEAGEWVRPKRRGYRLACCDCGLVHTLDFKLVSQGSGKAIIFRAFRNERATAAMRRRKHERT